MDSIQDISETGGQMTDILNNALIHKYFSQEKDYPGGMSERVLAAMQEPIRKGEQAIWYRQVHDEWKVGVWDGTELDSFHPFSLRLPTRFQEAGTKECEHRWFGIVEECIDCKVVRTLGYPGQKLQPPDHPEKCGCVKIP
jgi:hypothetical protein